MRPIPRPIRTPLQRNILSRRVCRDGPRHLHARTEKDTSHATVPTIGWTQTKKGKPAYRRSPLLMNQRLIACHSISSVTEREDTGRWPIRPSRRPDRNEPAGLSGRGCSCCAVTLDQVDSNVTNEGHIVATAGPQIKRICVAVHKKKCHVLEIGEERVTPGSLPMGDTNPTHQQVRDCRQQAGPVTQGMPRPVRGDRPSENNLVLHPRTINPTGYALNLIYAEVSKNAVNEKNDG
jgi:hypothetical protein